MEIRHIFILIKEKILAYKKAEQLYKEDRKTAYRKLADFMAEHGDCWWD